MNIPTDQALDRMMEMFLDSLGVHEPIINEELVHDAFYAGARAMCIIEEVQEADTEEEVFSVIENGGASVDEVNAILSEVVFEEANYCGGEA